MHSIKMWKWNDGTNYLMHHGIKGQRWGISNGPPYPLDQKSHNKVVSGKQKKLRMSGSEYRATKKRKLSIDEQSGSPHYTHRYTTDFHDGRESVNWSDWQTRELIVASDLEEPTNVATLLDQNEDFHRNLSKGMTLNKLAHANPGFGEQGTTNNCMKDTAALEMLYRGYGVCAGRSLGGGHMAAMQYWFNGARPYKESSLESAIDRISSFGNQGRGEIRVQWPDGVGHSIYFCNEWEGKRGLTVLDGQIGRGNISVPGADHPLLAYCKEHGVDLSRGFTITRLDDTTPNFGHMAEDNVLRMEYTEKSMNAIYNPAVGLKKGGKYIDG